MYKPSKSEKVKKIEKVIESCETFNHINITRNWVAKLNLGTETKINLLWLIMDKTRELADIGIYNERKQQVRR